jgi:hypothetical protein
MLGEINGIPPVFVFDGEPCYGDQGYVIFLLNMSQNMKCFETGLYWEILAINVVCFPYLIDAKLTCFF